MNDLVNLDHQKILKSLKFPVARCVAECGRTSKIVDSDDQVLHHEVFLCHGEHFIRTFSLWVEHGLVNGVVGCIEDIFYSPCTKPPQLP